MTVAYCPLCNNDTHTIKASGIVSSQTSSMQWNSSSASVGNVYDRDGRFIGSASGVGPDWGRGTMSTSLADRVRRAQNTWRFAPWKPIEMPEWAARLYAVALIVNEAYGRRVLLFSAFTSLLIASQSRETAQEFIWMAAVAFLIAVPIIFGIALTANYRRAMSSTRLRPRIQGTIKRVLMDSQSRRRRWEAAMQDWHRERAQRQDLWYCSRHDALLWPNHVTGQWAVYPE